VKYDSSPAPRCGCGEYVYDCDCDKEINTKSKRYSAEPRGGWEGTSEWCIVDEDVGPFGSVIMFGLTRERAKELANDWNKRESKE
jgi:hypothetical protein